MVAHGRLPQPEFVGEPPDQHAAVGRRGCGARIRARVGSATQPELARGLCGIHRWKSMGSAGSPDEGQLQQLDSQPGPVPCSVAQDAPSARQAREHTPVAGSTSSTLRGRGGVAGEPRGDRAHLLVSRGEEECRRATVALHAREEEVRSRAAELGESVRLDGAAAVHVRVDERREPSRGLDDVVELEADLTEHVEVRPEPGGVHDDVGVVRRRARRRGGR